jgi:hypothetical protein
MICRKSKNWTLVDYLQMLDFDLTNSCFEIRTISLDKKIKVGFFNDLNAAQKEIERYNTFSNLYVAPNPRKLECPDILDFKISNKIEYVPSGGAGKTTSVKSVRWFLIDIDTTKKITEKECMATQEEVDSSKKVCDDVVKYLKERNIDPIVAFSGNGWHLMVKTIDYEITIQESFKNLLNYLKNLFHCDAADIDIKMSDPVRIWKCYGTQAMKGENTPERPYRYAELKYVPDKIIPIDIIKIFEKELQNKQKVQSESLTNSSWALFNATLEAFKNSNLYIKNENNGMHSVICPWASQHSSNTGTKQTVLYEPNEKNLKLGLGFNCQHSSHGEKKSKDVLEYFNIDSKAIQKQVLEIEKQKELELDYKALVINRETFDKDVQGLVEEKDFACQTEVMMVFAQDSCGKTLLLLEMAYGFATGNPFWGGSYHPLKPTKVLFLNTDKSNKCFNNRYMRKMFGVVPPNPSVHPNLHVIHKMNYKADQLKVGKDKSKIKDLTLDLSRESLEYYIKKEQIEVFIVDGLSSAAGRMFNANENKSCIALSDLLNELSVTCNVFTAFSHHSNKLGRPPSGKSISLEQDDFQGGRQLSAQINYSLGIQRKDKALKINTISLMKEGSLAFFKTFDFKINNNQEHTKVWIEYLKLLSDEEEKKLELEKIMKEKNEIINAMNSFFLRYPNEGWVALKEIRERLKIQELKPIQIKVYLDQLITENLVVSSGGRLEKYAFTESCKTKLKPIEKDDV